MLTTVVPFLLFLSGLSLADSKPLKSSDGERSPTSAEFDVGGMDLSQEAVLTTNPRFRNPHHALSHDNDRSFYDSIVLNGDFATGDTSGWSIESPAGKGKWIAHVSDSSATKVGSTAHSSLKVTVPGSSYVMMFQDIDYNSTSSYVVTTASTEGANIAAKDEVSHTSAHTIPFQKGDPYVLNFDYRFDASCAAGSSLYYGVVSSEDLVDLEGDMEKSTLSPGNADSWTSFRGRVKPSTEWGSLYLYFMTKEKGGCTFEFADVGLWRVVAESGSQSQEREL